MPREILIGPRGQTLKRPRKVRRPNMGNPGNRGNAGNSGRIPVIVGGKVDREAQAKLTRKPGSKVNPKSTLTPAEWLDSGRWVGVVSSNVKKIRWDKKRYDLYVGFLNGSIYKYPGVDRGLARSMYQSASMGKAVWRLFRWPGRPYQRVK